MALNYDLEDQDTILAYDSQGKEFYLNTLQEPELPVVVVGINERVTLKPQLVSKENLRTTSDNSQQSNLCTTCYYNSAPVYSDEQFDYFLKSNVSTNCGGGPVLDPSPNPEPPTPTCDRSGSVLNNKEEVTRIKFRSTLDLRTVEPWQDGAPEMKLKIFTQAQSSPYVETDFNYRRSDYKDCALITFCDTKWVNTNRKLFIWDKTDGGDDIKYMWIEEDNGTTEQYTFNGTLPDGSTIQYSTTIKSNDKVWVKPVEWCESIPYIYDAGAFFFEIDRKRP